MRLRGLVVHVELDKNRSAARLAKDTSKLLWQAGGVAAEAGEAEDSEVAVEGRRAEHNDERDSVYKQSRSYSNHASAGPERHPACRGRECAAIWSKCRSSSMEHHRPWKETAQRIAEDMDGGAYKILAVPAANLTVQLPIFTRGSAFPTRPSSASSGRGLSFAFAVCLRGRGLNRLLFRS
jgi:hypothetical protein